MPAGSRVTPSVATPRMAGDGSKVSPDSVQTISKVNGITISQETDQANENDQAITEEENEESAWISSHVNMRLCCKFVPKVDRSKPMPDDPPCHCGYLRSEHTDKALANFREEDTVWKTNLSTEAVPTNAYGDIEFVGYGQKLSKYVRIDNQTDENLILDLMLDQWDLERPKLLISVTGGAKNFHMRPKLKEVFRRGLMKAAASTGAWIVTGGMHAGVMKHVGEAVQDHLTAEGNKAKVVAIGIASWGCVNNKFALEAVGGSWPAQYRVEKPKQRKQSPIDRNHSHFLFLDNGTQLQFGTEIAFRAKLERAISLMTTEDDSTVSVPVVCVLLEGGPGSLETAKSAIQNGTPCVVVEGSGRAADILAFAYANSREEEVKVIDKLGKEHRKTVAIVDDEVWEEVGNRIKAEWDTRDLERRLSWVKECLEHRDHMTVFRLEAGDTVDIDVAILQALLKVNKDQSIEQLRLALTWNRIDVANSDIFTEDKKWDPGELDDVMYTALMNDRVDFVKLFMENGVSLKNFLTIKRLLQMYNNIPKKSLLYKLLRKNNKQNKYFSLEDIGNLIEDLMGDFYSTLYKRDLRYTGLNVHDIMDDNLIEAVSQVAMKSTTNIDQAIMAQEVGAAPAFGEKFVKGITRFVYVDQNTGEQFTKADFDEPAREIFLWCVLMNRLDMGMIFWDEGKEGTSSALVAQTLLKSLVDKIDDSEQEKSLRENEEHFAQLSVGLLSKCYVTEEKNARLLLVRNLPNFGNTTTLTLAVNADNKHFIAHPACQALLNNIWRGRIALDVGTLSIMASILCPPLIFPLIRYRADDRKGLSELEHVKKKKKKDCDDLYELERVDSPGMNSRKESQQRLLSEEKRRRNKREKEDKNQLTCWERISFFYNTPMITFIHNCISYLVFLAFYSIVLLVHFEKSVHYMEVILIAWVVTLFAEEIRQIIEDDSSTIARKLLNYVQDVWNILDMVTIFSFLLGLLLRSIPTSSCDSCFEAARVVLALNLMTFCFRILHIFSVHKELGPKLVMIGRMMRDLGFFLLILMVFIAAFGLATQAILYPNSELSIGLIRDVLHKPYWQMYGELFLEELEGDIECSSDPLLWNNGTLNVARCPENTWVVPILLGAYILITNVLMLNLLIAMFSYTFDNIQENTDQHWYFQRYFLVKEYVDYPPLVPPLIVISHIHYIIRRLLSCCSTCIEVHTTNDFKVELEEGEEKQLIVWENINADDYLRDTHSQEKLAMENQVRETNERVDELSRKVEEIAESNFMVQSSSSGATPKLPPALDERISYLEEQMKRTSRALDWIIQAMMEKGQGAKGGPPDLRDIDKIREDKIKARQEQADREKEQYQVLLQKQLELHITSRSSHYPCLYQVVLRFNVPNVKVPWEVAWPDYEPVRHTDKAVLEQPDWADIDLMAMEPEQRPKLKFNEYDEELKVNRKSYLGEYEVKEGIPYNPMGRTGLVGRGSLGKWGPNHAGDPIVTRWAKNDKGEFLMEDNKKILEFVAIYRQDAKQWALPGSIIADKPVYSCLKAEFTEEALGTLMDDKAQREEIEKKLDALWALGEEVYRGYSDDPRNTDNAWLETVAVNYHDQEGSILRHFQLRAGESVELVRWMKIDSRQTLYGSHLAILQKVATKHAAAF